MAGYLNAPGVTNYFPIAFPTAIYGFSAIHQGNASSVNVVVDYISNTEFTAYSNWTSAYNVTIRWIAIGF